MIVQIYETSNVDEALKLARLGVVHVGMHVSDNLTPTSITPKTAKEICDNLEGIALSSVISVSKIFGEYIDLANTIVPDIIHIGADLDEISKNDLGKIRSAISPSIKIMRTIPIYEDLDFGLIDDLKELVDFFLLDTYNHDRSFIGATGKPHDWNLSRRFVELSPRPVILAGGIGADNVIEAIKKVQPYGIDSKTKTDSEDGTAKDLVKVAQLIEKVNPLMYS